MSKFAELVRVELASIRDRFPEVSSLHGGYAFILEEMDEFWDEVKKKQADRDNGRLTEELVQIAAMCQATAEDCGLIPN